MVVTVLLRKKANNFHINCLGEQTSLLLVFVAVSAFFPLWKMKNFCIEQNTDLWSIKWSLTVYRGYTFFSFFFLQTVIKNSMFSPQQSVWKECSPWLAVFQSSRNTRRALGIIVGLNVLATSPVWWVLPRQSILSSEVVTLVNGIESNTDYCLRNGNYTLVWIPNALLLG